MIVTVNINSVEVKVSVGNGLQNFRWLAKTVEGRVRHFNLLRTTNAPDTIVLNGFTNSIGELINPMDKLCEHASTKEGEYSLPILLLIFIH